MTTYVLGNGGLVNKDTGEFIPSDPNAPPVKPRIIVSDSTEPLRSMADGRLYTSKAAMRDSYKARNNPQGVDYIEVGDDPAFVNPKLRPKPKPDRAAIRESIQRAEADLNAGRLG